MLLQVSVMGECRTVVLDGSQDAFTVEESLLFNSSTTIPTINLAVLDDAGLSGTRRGRTLRSRTRAFVDFPSFSLPINPRR